MSVSKDALDRAVEAVGSTAELARKVGVTPQNITNWRKRGVPAAKVPAVVRACSGAVQPHELRPDLPELFAAPGTQAA